MGTSGNTAKLNITANMDADMSNSPSRPKSGINVDNEILQNMIDMNSNIDKVYYTVGGLKNSIEYQKNAQMDILEQLHGLHKGLNDMNSRIITLEEGHKTRSCASHSKRLDELGASVNELDKKISVMEAERSTEDKDKGVFRTLVSTRIGLVMTGIGLVVTMLGVVASLVFGIIQAIT